MTATEKPAQYTWIVNDLVKSLEDLEPDSWVERACLERHVKSRWVKQVKGLGVDGDDGNEVKEDHLITAMLLNDALAQLTRQGRCQACTEGGVEQFRFSREGVSTAQGAGARSGPAAGADAPGDAELPQGNKADGSACDLPTDSDCAGPHGNPQAARHHDKRDEVASAPTDEAARPPEPCPAGATAVPAGPRPTSDPDLEIDPEFEQLLPPLTAEEGAQLEQNLIDDRVCSRPFKRWQGTKLLIDGHHRFPICARHGIPYRIEDIALPDREAVIQWILGNQLGQRNLPPDYVRYARGKLYESRTRQGHRTDLTDVTSGQSGQKLDTAEGIAATGEVSARTVRRDAQYAAAVDTIVSNCGAAARSAILSRGAGLSIQDVGEIAKLPAEEQQAEVKRLVETKRTGKKKRAKSKQTGGDQAARPRASHEGHSAGEAGSPPPVAPKAFLKRLARVADDLAQSVRELPALARQLTAADKAEAKATGQQITASAGALAKLLKPLKS